MCHCNEVKKKTFAQRINKAFHKNETCGMEKQRSQRNQTQIWQICQQKIGINESER